MSEFFEGLSEIFEIDLDKVQPDLSFDEVDWDLSQLYQLLHLLMKSTVYF